jgi:hypothetical protein
MTLARPVRLVRPTSRSLLSRVLDQPDLPAQIQNLPSVVFGKLIDQIGLEDAGELVALATTEQIAHAFDEDLWKNLRPGQEEHFDTDRFLVWLEVLLEAGDAFAASRLVEMPEDLVTLALHKHILVLDIEALALQMRAADEVEARQLDKALESLLYEEVEGFQLMARNPEGWDNVFSVVLALDRDHHEFLQRVLERCCSMSTEYLDDNGGLYEVLTSEEMIEADLAGEREDRRAEAGHVAPLSAAAFLKLAKASPPEGKRDPVTRAYFRNLRPAAQRTPAIPSRARLGSGQKAHGLAQVLMDARVPIEASAQHLPMLPAKQGDPSESLLVDAMRTLADADPRVFGERSEELAYLTNVLLAGCTLQQRRLRPIEAVRVALATCNLGLCLVLPARPTDLSKPALAALQQIEADNLFRTGCHWLHKEVVEPAARVAQRLLAKAASNAESEECAAYKRAASALDKACQQGAPWQAMSALDNLLSTIDARDVDVLRGLTDQCPTFPVAAESGPHADGKTPGAQPLRYPSTPAVVHEIQQFLERLEEEPRTVATPPPTPPRKPRASGVSRKTAKRQ